MLKKRVQKMKDTGCTWRGKKLALAALIRGFSLRWVSEREGKSLLPPEKRKEKEKGAQEETVKVSDRKGNFESAFSWIERESKWSRKEAPRSGGGF